MLLLTNRVTSAREAYRGDSLPIREHFEGIHISHLSTVPALCGLKYKRYSLLNIWPYTYSCHCTSHWPKFKNDQNDPEKPLDGWEEIPVVCINYEKATEPTRTVL